MDTPNTNMTGRVAIVTGAASGIGRATARMFAAAGAQVLACDRSPAIADLAADRIVPVEMDAGSEADVVSVIDRAMADFGRLDVFFANAGITGGVREVADHSPDIWAEVLRINLIGPFLAVKHAAPKMGPGGVILATASVAGILVFSNQRRNL